MLNCVTWTYNFHGNHTGISTHILIRAIYSIHSIIVSCDYGVKEYGYLVASIMSFKTISDNWKYMAFASVLEHKSCSKFWCQDFRLMELFLPIALVLFRQTLAVEKFFERWVFCCPGISTCRLCRIVSCHCHFAHSDDWAILNVGTDLITNPMTN